MGDRTLAVGARLDGVVDGDRTLAVGVRRVEDVDGGAGSGVVDLDGVLGAMAGATGFSCQGPLGALAGLLIARGRLRPGLDLLGARILDQRSGLDRCHPNPSHSSPSSPLSLSAPPLLHRDCCTDGAGCLYGRHCTALHCTALYSPPPPPLSPVSRPRG